MAYRSTRRGETQALPRRRYILSYVEGLCAQITWAGGPNTSACRCESSRRQETAKQPSAVLPQ
jgi:hypothetical protein